MISAAVRRAWLGPVAALCVSGCGAGERSDAPLEPVAFSVGPELALQMELPAGVQIAAPRERMQRFSLNPNIRIPRFIDVTALETPAASETTDFDRRVVWSGGRALDYSVSTGPGGSGGTSYDLNGRLSLPGALLDVHCHTQDEFGDARSAMWCLDYLETLQPASAASGGD